MGGYGGHGAEEVGETIGGCGRYGDSEGGKVG